VTGEARPKWVIIYETLNEEEPFTNWLNNLRDAIGRKRILARVARLEDGNYGDCEPQSVKVSASCGCSSDQVTEFILAKMATILSSCSAAETKIAKTRTFNKQKPTDRSI
jgi:hypothetical protein